MKSEKQNYFFERSSVVNYSEAVKLYQQNPNGKTLKKISEQLCKEWYLENNYTFYVGQDSEDAMANAFDFSL